MGAQDGSYPATGFHTRGEMGGFWTPPVKLLDGIWFKAGGSWLTASRYTSGWGYQRMDLGTHNGVRITRTDFAPDGIRAGLIGLRLDTTTATTLPIAVDAHSELMKAYPWGETTPSQTTYNLPDTGAVSGKNLVFREQGTPPGTNARRTTTPPSWARASPRAAPRSDPTTAVRRATSCARRPARAPDPRRTAATTRRTARAPAGSCSTTCRCPRAAAPSGSRSAAPTTVSPRRSRHSSTRSPTRPRCSARRSPRRNAIAANTRVSLPGDRLLQRSVAWSKQNLAESVQESRNLQVRPTNGGTNYPAPVGTVAKARWYGAGFPDYPWLFATDGEYTSFAAVSSGQFATIKAHLRALRDVSVAANGQSGKVVHEVTPDGQVYFGANADAGNTDETAKFPSIVALVWRWTGDNAFRDEMYGFAKRNMRYIYRELDADHDGWPEGLGNVEVTGMGTEKLDNTVYTIRGLRDLADLAASKHDTATQAVGDDEGRRPRAALRHDVVERPGHAAVRRLAERPRQPQGLPAPLDRRHAGRGRS